MPETVIAGRYRLDELLGRGGMSEVWAAHDAELGRRVAIKLLAPDADTTRFEREARAFASLAHPNVTQLYDYGEENGRPYMVLEYLGGGTLEDRLRGDRPLPDDETLAIATGIAAGLAHAHARGVVHRDLKPANVLFDGEGRPKLADFGIARMTAGDGTLTEAGTVLGTAAYISPEQASGAPASAASDVYSFGVILYRMLTGRLPFESNDPLQLVLQHRDAAPPPITSIRADAPAALEAVATAALTKDPRQRPRDGAALLAELGVPAAAGPTTLSTAATQVLPAAAATAPSYPKPPPRNRLPIVAAGLAILALAGGALAYEITRPSSSSGDTGTIPSITIPSQSTGSTTTSSTTSAGSTTAQTTTEGTTAAPPTTTQQQTQPTTTSTTSPPTTATTPPATTTDVTTTAPTTIP